MPGRLLQNPPLLTPTPVAPVPVLDRAQNHILQVTITGACTIYWGSLVMLTMYKLLHSNARWLRRTLIRTLPTTSANLGVSKVRAGGRALPSWCRTSASQGLQSEPWGQLEWTPNLESIYVYISILYTIYRPGAHWNGPHENPPKGPEENR